MASLFGLQVAILSPRYYDVVNSFSRTKMLQDLVDFRGRSPLLVLRQDDPPLLLR